MPKSDVELIRESWAWVKPADGDWTATGVLFYTQMFERDPSLPATIFKGSNIEEQAMRLMPMIDAAVNLLEKPDTLVPMLRKLGERHAGYGVVDAHYPPAGAALIATLRKGLGAKLTPEHEAAWVRVWGVIETEMRAGSATEEGQKKAAEFWARHPEHRPASAQRRRNGLLLLAGGAVAVAAVIAYRLTSRPGRA